MGNSQVTNYQQPVDVNYTYTGKEQSTFVMISNYIYLYHTDTLIVIPTYPESIADQMQAKFSETTVLSRSAPIYSYSGSGPRSFSVQLHLHRDMMNAVNIGTCNLNVPNLADEDYVDILVKQMQASVLPRYSASEKMVNPPMVALRFGNEISCKGVLTGGLTTTYSGPILASDKYAEVTIDFAITEVDPYDADSVMTIGSLRGINLDLERNVWKPAGSTVSSSTPTGLKSTSSSLSSRGSDSRVATPFRSGSSQGIRGATLR